MDWVCQFRLFFSTIPSRSSLLLERITCAGILLELPLVMVKSLSFAIIIIFTCKLIINSCVFAFSFLIFLIIIFSNILFQVNFCTSRILSQMEMNPYQQNSLSAPRPLRTRCFLIGPGSCFGVVLVRTTL